MEARSLSVDVVRLTTCVAAACALALSACSGATGAAASLGESTADVVYGAGLYTTSPSTDESGVFFVSRSDGLLSYYDFASGSGGPICSDAACSHSDDSCVAWLGDAPDGAAPGGFAHYGDALYAVRQSPDGGSMELLRIDPAAQTKESVAEFGEAGGGSGWVVSMVGDTYYAGGRAWVTLQYQTVGASDEGADLRSAVQLLSVDLSTGGVDDLTGVASDADGLSRLRFSCVGADVVLYEWAYYDEAPLGRAECLAQGGSEEGYIGYLDEYYGEATELERITEVDAASCSQSVLWEGELEKTYIPSWNTTYSHAPYSYYGVYDGKLLRSQLSVEDGKFCTTLSLLSADGGAEELLYLEDGDLMARDDGEGASLVYSDGTFIYQLGLDGDSQTYYSYSLETGESEELFTGAASEVLQVCGETSDRLVGRIDGELAWMYKDDFEAGNFSRRTRST